ncbi:hypothetical protein MMC21_002805 [Puttea exsequens]|nr:hypothetical protein [Puttea exsequens]
MSDGLAGHEYEFYHIVKHSPWLGGYSEYSILHEGLPYWFNGLVPLAYGLDDTRLKLQVQDVSDFVINHQQADGWLGPEAVGDRDIWGRFPFFLGLCQLVEAEPTRGPKIIPAMYKFISLMHSMLIDHIGFDEIWGRVRFPDMIISLQWLYEFYPEGNEQLLLETMYLLRFQGYDWPGFWTNESFLFDDLDTIQPPITAQSPLFPFTHGVNAAQGLKAGAVVYRFTKNEALLQNNRDGVNWTFTYHGDPAGSLIGDEREAGINANRGTELCTTVEMMYSMSYLYQMLGDNYFADRCELAAFNALPVSITSDHWARQYLALASEPYAQVLRGPNPFWNVGPHGIIYGLETNYPCCTVNMPQGLPKFLAAMFVRVGENGLGHALLAPANVSTTTAFNTSVDITCDTNYPFSPILRYNVTASAPFTLYLRVPSWYVWENSSIELNNNGFQYPLERNQNTGVTPVALSAGTTSITYTLGGAIRVEPRANSTVAIYHGSLLYALDVGQSVTALATSLYNVSYTNNITTNTHFPYNTSSRPPIPPTVHDFAITNTRPWNIAIDTSTLTFHTALNSTNDNATALPNPLFDYQAAPSYITAKGCEIAWPLYKGLPAPLPAPANGTMFRTCTSNVTDVVLRPYGTLKVHMAELPLVDLSRNVTVRRGGLAEHKQHVLGPRKDQ